MQTDEKTIFEAQIIDWYAYVFSKSPYLPMEVCEYHSTFID
jgi:hypothetical protein